MLSFIKKYFQKALYFEYVATQDEYSCLNCMKLDGMKILNTSEMKIYYNKYTPPYSQCTSCKGCRCKYIPVFKTTEGALKWVKILESYGGMITQKDIFRLEKKGEETCIKEKNELYLILAEEKEIRRIYNQAREYDQFGKSNESIALYKEFLYKYAQKNRTKGMNYYLNRTLMRLSEIYEEEKNFYESLKFIEIFFERQNDLRNVIKTDVKDMLLRKERILHKMEEEEITIPKFTKEQLCLTR